MRGHLSLMQKTQRGKDMKIWAGALLAGLTTFVVFLPALRNGFLELDDVGYIVDNRHIAALNGNTVVWSFTHFYEANWHPLTMLSLALDRQLWGENPFGFHLTNIVLHSATVFLSCFLFASLLEKSSTERGAAERRGRDRNLVAAGSVAAALFFGLHPLRVESVVWASERKDVLCIFFVTASLWWHLRYVERRSARPERGFPAFGAYWMTLVSASLALLSKPVAVSLPLVLLIVDWYPLARITGRDSFRGALTEKAPLLLMAAGSALLTISAQHEPMSLLAGLTLSSRLLIACKAAIFYLWKTVWPASLAPYYPHPGNVAETAAAEYLPYAAGVVALSAAAVVSRGRRVWPASWLYFLVTLAPMLGIVQTGGQWMADRYSYLPSLGLSLLWGAGVTSLIRRMRKKGHPAIAALVIGVAASQVVCYAVATERLIPVWRSTETVATREIGLFPHQAGAAYDARARYRFKAGEYAEALEDIDEALAIARRRGFAEKYSGLSMTRAGILVRLGRLQEALDAADWAIQKSEGIPPAGYLEFRDELRRKVAPTEGERRK